MFLDAIQDSLDVGRAQRMALCLLPAAARRSAKALSRGGVAAGDPGGHVEDFAQVSIAFAADVGGAVEAALALAQPKALSGCSQFLADFR